MLALQTVAQASKARPSVTQPMQPSEGVSAAAAAAVTQPTAPSTETIPADGSHENDTLNSFHIKFDPTINPSQFAFDLRDENADSDPDISEESSIQQRSSPINTDFDLDGPPSASKLSVIKDEEDVLPQDATAEFLKWHHRLGHISSRKIRTLAGMGILPKALLNCKVPLCTSCLFGKATRRLWKTPFQTMRKSFDTFKQQVGKATSPVVQPPEGASAAAAAQRPTSPADDIPADDPLVDEQQHVHFADDEIPPAVPPEGDAGQLPTTQRRSTHQRLPPGRFEHLRKVDDDVVHHFAPTALHPLISPITKDGISHLRDNTAIIYDAFIETQWTGHSIPKANGFSQFETIEQDDSEPISFKANLFSKDDFRLRGADTASSAPDESLRSLH